MLFQYFLNIGFSGEFSVQGQLGTMILFSANAYMLSITNIYYTLFNHLLEVWATVLQVTDPFTEERLGSIVQLSIIPVD